MPNFEYSQSMKCLFCYSKKPKYILKINVARNLGFIPDPRTYQTGDFE